MRNYIIGAFIALALCIGSIISLKGCNEHSGASEQEINRVLEVHHDTIVRIDSVLKYKVKVVHDLAPDAVDSAFQRAFPADTFYMPSDTIKQVVTVYQEKRCIEAVDSLNAYKQIVAVDSQTIDTLSKLAKTKEASPTLIDDAKKVGIGVLIGITIRSLF